MHTHIAAWVAFIFSYAPILDAYVTSKSYSSVKPPDFVTLIVIVTFVIFMLFGVAQVPIAFPTSHSHTLSATFASPWQS